MSKSQEKESRRGIAEYLSVKAELPSDALAGECRVELRGRNMLFVNGCRRILKYSSDEIVFAVRHDSVKILGERLACTSYHAGAVCVEGNIISVSFGGGE